MKGSRIPTHKPDEVTRYERHAFLDLLNAGNIPKSLNLRRVMELLVALFDKETPKKEIPEKLAELNQRLLPYTIGLEFASPTEPEWIANWPEQHDLGGLPLFDTEVIRLLPGLIGSGDFQRLACCPAPGCGRFFFKRLNQTFCKTVCANKAYRSTHKKKHREYMKEWRNNPAVGRRKR